MAAIKQCFFFFFTLISFISSAQCFKDVQAGNNHVLMLKNDGTLWTWGQNSSGQLGIGYTSSIERNPVQVGTGTDWKFIAAGSDHSFGIKNDGSLWAWGWNAYGKLGIGSLNNQLSPVQVGSDKDWLFVAASSNHTLAIKADSSLWGWGSPANYALGYYETENQLSPKKLNSDKWQTVDCSIYQSAGIKTNGKLFLWGNSQPLTSTPFTFGPEIWHQNLKWKSVACGSSHMLALTADNSLYAKGTNSNGQLGIGTLENKTTLTGVLSSSFIKIDVNNQSSVAIHNVSSTYFEWGKGLQQGQDKLSPFNTGVIFKDITIGESFGIGTKPDGTLWGFGRGDLILRETTMNKGNGMQLSDVCSYVTSTDNIQTNAISVYPNPITDFIRIQSKEFQNQNFNYTLYDFAGSIVQAGKGAFNQNLNLQNITPGTYVLELTFNQKKIHQKLIKL